MINVLLCGANGRMGNAVRRIANENPALCIVAGFDIKLNL